MEGEDGLLKDARRLLAVNSAEQKRLEKLQRYIEKKRREKERMLTRAQNEAVAKFYENSREYLYTDKVYLSAKPVTASIVVSKGHEMAAAENTTVREARSKETPLRPHKKLSLQENSSKGFLPGLDLTVFGLRAQQGQPLHRRRTRSWSNPESLEDLTYERSKYRDESILKVKHEDQTQKQKHSIQENIDEETREEAPKKPLSAILPPLVLPPLHEQRRPSLQEHNKNFYKVEGNLLYGDKSLKEQYEDLSECRYLRVYQRKADI